MRKFFLGVLGVFCMGVGLLFATPAEVQRHLQEGQEHVKNEAFSNAIVSFKRCIELDRSFAPAYFNVALVSMWMKEYQQADRYVREFIKLRDTEPQAYVLLARVSLELEHFDDVEPSLQRAVQLSPENPAILYNVADVWFLINQAEKAYHVAKKGVSFLPQNDQSELAQRLWATVLFTSLDMERYDEAMKACEMLLSFPLVKGQREMVEAYREDIRFFQRNVQNPLFIRSYKVTRGVIRGAVEAYGDEIAANVYFVTGKRIGSGEGGSSVPAQMLPLVMQGCRISRVELATRSPARSEISSLFGTMVGANTIVVVVRTAKGETGYLLFEPAGQRVLLKAAYIPGGTFFRL